MSRDRHDEIAVLLRQRLEALRKRDAEVAIRPRTENRAKAPEPGWDPGAALQLRGRWIADQVGGSLETMLKARAVAPYSDLLEVTTTRTGVLEDRPWERPRAALEASLWLLPGIRDATMKLLNRDGFRDLSGLTDHPRFGPSARKVLRLIQRGKPERLMDHIGFRGGRGHLLSLALAGLYDPDQLLFLDIETMGLFGGSPVIQVGLAWIEGPDLRIRQLVARTPEGEDGLVRETVEALEASPALVTFNGRAFDFPYICQRAAFYGRPVTCDPVHFDLLPYSRRVWKGRTSNCRLGTLAREVLGLKRHEDVSGALVPRFYQDYLEDPGERYGLLAGIVNHNLDDMVEMVLLFERLMKECQGGL